MAESDFLVADIPDVVRRLRKQHGLTLRDVAQRTNLSVSYLSDIECGRTTPTLSTLDTIFHAYDLMLTIQAKAGDAIFEMFGYLETQILYALEKRDWPTVFRLMWGLTAPQGSDTELENTNSENITARAQ